MNEAVERRKIEHNPDDAEYTGLLATFWNREGLDVVLSPESARMRGTIRVTAYFGKYAVDFQPAKLPDQIVLFDAEDEYGVGPFYGRVRA